MAKCRVVFTPPNKEVTVESGTSLLDAASLARISIKNLCGGEGGLFVTDDDDILRKGDLVRYFGDECDEKTLRQKYCFFRGVTIALNLVRQCASDVLPRHCHVSVYAFHDSVVSTESYDLVPRYSVQPFAQSTARS